VCGNFFAGDYPTVEKEVVLSQDLNSCRRI
jgi:hypothetical protein